MSTTPKKKKPTVPTNPPASALGKKFRTLVGITIDESSSMGVIQKETVKGVNAYIDTLKGAGKDQDVYVRVTTFGDRVREILPLTPIADVTHIKESAYRPNGMTALFDGIGEMSDYFAKRPEAADKDVAFLVHCTTDGGENASTRSAKDIQRVIADNQRTDRWTYAFLCPQGGRNELVRHGIESGNVQEWEASSRGAGVASVQTVGATQAYFASRSLGVTSTKTFYADLSNVTKKDLKKLDDITSDVKLWEVKDEQEIRPFVESKLKGKPMLKGSAFYMLMKKEKKVQDYKKIVLVEKKTKKVLFGNEVRQFLGLPAIGDVPVEPGNFGDFEVYVQSTSTNRKLPRGTKVLYYEAIGTPFTEGPSAR